MRDIAFQAERFKFAMAGNQQGSARSLVTPARLDTHKPVLYQIDSADRIASANLVEQLDQRNGIKLHPIHRNRSTLLEADYDLLLAIWGILRRAGQLPRAGERSIACIFQFPAFVADVPQVAIAAMNLFAAGGNGNSPLLGIVETIFARLQIPLPPWGDDLQLRS